MQFTNFFSLEEYAMLRKARIGALLQLDAAVEEELEGVFEAGT